MKKGLISILLIIAMLFTLVSCAAKDAMNDMIYAPGAENGDFYYNLTDGLSGAIAEEDVNDAVVPGGAIENIYSDPNYGRFIENQFIPAAKESTVSENL